MRGSVALAAMLSLGGCVTTVPVEFYLPRGDGELIDAVCVPGPPHTLRIELPDGAELILAAAPASLHSPPSPQIVLNVHFIVPAGATLRLTAGEVHVTSDAWSSLRLLPIVKIEDWTAGSVPVPALQPLATLAGTARTAAYPGYQLAFANEGPRGATQLPAVAAFELSMPAIEIGGRSVDVAPIAFQRQTWRGVHLVCD